MNIIIILCSKKFCAIIPFLNMTCIHSMIVFQNSTEAMIEARKASNKRVYLSLIIDHGYQMISYYVWRMSYNDDNDHDDHDDHGGRC